MLDPYRMVVVNIILSFILLIGTLIYRFLYPKKKINLFFLLILIGLLPLISMLRQGTYESGDLSWHTIRVMSFYKIISLEHIFPAWTPEWFGGFGIPFFSFGYILPYIIASIFHFIGFSFLASTKMLLASSYLLSGIFIYLFVKDDLGKKAGFTAAIFFLFSPIHLINMHFEAAIAMVLSYLFLPLCLHLTKKILLETTFKWGFLLIFSVALLILSHQVISLSFFPVIILYGLFLIKIHKIKFKAVSYFLISLGYSLLLTFFYWIPILYESEFTQQAINPNHNTLLSLSDLLYSPHRFGLLFQGGYGELYRIIGYTQIVVVLLSFFILRKKNYIKIKKLTLFFLLLLFIYTFMITSFSRPIWEFIPLMKYFEYSARLLVIVSFLTAVIAGLVVKVFNKNWLITALCSLTILYTILNWGNRTTIPSVNDNTLSNKEVAWPGIGKDSGLVPPTPIWINKSNLKNLKYRSANIEILSGNATVRELSRSSKLHEYLISVKSDQAKFKENTLYFPGWKVIEGSTEHNIDYTNKKYTGIVIFNLKKGTHKIKVIYTNTMVRRTSQTVSIVALVTIILALFYNFLFVKQIVNNNKHIKFF